MNPLHEYIWERDGGICVYCKDTIGQEFDHVLARKHRGKTIKENLVVACRRCNRIKFDRLDESLITIAFTHLLKVGESLDWVDRLLGNKIQIIQKEVTLTTTTKIKEIYIKFKPISKKKELKGEERDLFNRYDRYLAQEKRLYYLIDNRFKQSLSNTPKSVLVQQLKNCKHRIKKIKQKIRYFNKKVNQIKKKS